MADPNVDLPDEVQQTYERAFAFVGRGRFAEAFPLLEACLQRRPDFILARKELALVLTRMGRTEDAIEQRRRILRLAPDDRVNRLKCVELLSELKRYEEAAQVVEPLARAPNAEPAQVRLHDKLRNLARHGRIFISYRSCDAQAARAVAELLLLNDFDVWFAEYNVLAVNYDDFEQELARNLRQALSDCRSAVLLTNRSWAESPYCQDEIRHISQHYDPARIFQICVPRPDDRTTQEWPVLRDVATTTCDFSNVAETDLLSAWLLDRLNVAPSDRRWIAAPAELGDPAPLLDAYRGGALGTLRTGPLRPVRTPWWQRLTNRADLTSLAYGWPSVAFRSRSPAPNGLVDLVVDVRPDRWTNLPELDLLLDDRAAYTSLRAVARSGYQLHEGMSEGGLHLFHGQGRGNLAITFRTPSRFGVYAWKRIYVIMVRNRLDGSLGEVNLNFSLTFPDETSGAVAFRRFCALLPLFDRIAGSLDYSGVRRRSPRARIRIAWAAAGAVGLTIVAAGTNRLFGGSYGAAVYGAAAAFGGVLGATLNHLLMVVSPKPAERVAEASAAELRAMESTLVLWARVLTAALLVGVVGTLLAGAYVGLAAGIVVGLTVGSSTTPGASPGLARDAEAGVRATSVVGSVIVSGALVAALAGALAILALQFPALAGFRPHGLLAAVAALIAVGLARAAPGKAFFAALAAGTTAGAAVVGHVAVDWSERSSGRTATDVAASVVIGAVLAGLWGGVEASFEYFDARRKQARPTSESP